MKKEKEEEKEKGLALLRASDLTKVDNTVLNPFQLQMLLKRTPKAYIRERPAKGGGKWKYVSGGYFRKVLNMMFGWDWDFEIKDKQIVFNQVIIEGRLTVRSNGVTVIKEQIGKKDIIYKKGTETPLDIGNDFKAAATDALKKCAAELGIAADVYNADEFKEVDLDLSLELSPSEIKREKEIDRLRELINRASDKDSLRELKEHIQLQDDDELLKKYYSKLLTFGVFRGEYKEEAVYYDLNFVTHNGSMFIANNPNEEPFSSEITNSYFWEKVPFYNSETEPESHD